MTILLIEDDPLWQAKMQQILHEIQLPDVAICDSLITARQFLLHTIPDIIITDIMLGEDLVFSLLEKEEYKKIPFVFITSSEDGELYNRAKQVPNAMFLVKPFHALSVQAAIDKVMMHHQKQLGSKPNGLAVRGIYNEKIFLKAADIIFVRSEWNYCVIKTPRNQFALKISLKKIIDDLGSDMIQIHRTYVVNKNYLLKANLQKMEVLTECGLLPIGRQYKQHVLEHLDTIRQL